jgi:hypothetical protein
MSGTLTDTTYPEAAASRRITPYAAAPAMKNGQNYSARMIVPGFFPLIAFSIFPRVAGDDPDVSAWGAIF